MKFLRTLCFAIIGLTLLPSVASAQGVDEVETIRRDIQPMTVLFEPGGFALTTAAMDQLNRLADRLRNTRDRIEITAYAGTAQISTQDAVKLSFKRGVIIRTLLIEAGVLANQIVVNARAQARDDGPAERADIQPIAR